MPAVQKMRLEYLPIVLRQTHQTLQTTDATIFANFFRFSINKITNNNNKNIFKQTLLMLDK